MERQHRSPTNGTPVFRALVPNGHARGVAKPPVDLELVSAPAAAEPTLDIADVAALAERLRASVRAGVHLPADVLDVVLAALLADGHLLVEDHPGVGKTQLARTLASSLGTQVSRVQATVDLLPSDIVGASVWRPEAGAFEFRPGPVFAHVVLVDELNRATPRTQSGLLEAMEERQVTVDGVSHRLPSPFIVIGTQNPSAAYDGTYALPAAQLDRFLARVSIGYPSAEQELALLSDGVPHVASVSTPGELRCAQQAVQSVHTSHALGRYVVALLVATRTHPWVEVGASPRAGLLLIAAARARAAIEGRDFVLPDDVQAMAPVVLHHRLRLSVGAPVDGAANVVADALAGVAAQ
jgi:MoxR-like ATPase